MTITYQRQGIMKKYINEMTNILSKIYPEKTRDELYNTVKEETFKAYKANPTKVQIEDLTVSINGMDRYINNENLIVAGSGSLYAQHEGSINIIAKMIEYLKSERNRYKKLKFKYMDEGDPVRTSRYDTRQKTIKVFNNSLYGVLTQASSIYFNPLSGPSITLSGQDIITTAVIAFERFIGANVFFSSIEDVLVYMNYIVNEDYSTVPKVSFKFYPTVDMVLTWILDRMDTYTETDEDIIYTYLTNLSDEDLLHIYYKDNLHEFINTSSFYEDYLIDIAARDDFLDPNEPPTDVADSLAVAWKAVASYVFYNHQDYHRFENMFSSEAKPRKRKAVLTIDTDKLTVPLYGNI